MSVVKVMGVSNVAARIDYEILGVGETKRNNLEHGTHRVAALTCDTGSVDAFIAKAQMLKATHSYKLEAYSYVQSFKNTEFDPENPDDVQRVNDLGWLLAKKMHPESDCLVITHVDGENHHPHNHIKVINHDEATGKSLHNEYRWFYPVKRANDELMKEQGCEVLPPKIEPKLEREEYWDKVRGRYDTQKFVQNLGDTISNVLKNDEVTDMESFENALNQAGVQIVIKEPRKKGFKPGITYKMRDEESNRIRRRKASSLSPEFTREGLEEIFQLKKEISEYGNSDRGIEEEERRIGEREEGERRTPSYSYAEAFHPNKRSNKRSNKQPETYGNRSGSTDRIGEQTRIAAERIRRQFQEASRIHRDTSNDYNQQQRSEAKQRKDCQNERFRSVLISEPVVDRNNDFEPEL